MSVKDIGPFLCSLATEDVLCVTVSTIRPRIVIKPCLTGDPIKERIIHKENHIKIRNINIRKFGGKRRSKEHPLKIKAYIVSGVEYGRILSFMKRFVGIAILERVHDEKYTYE